MVIDLVKYLPVATAVLSASLGYIYGVRGKKNDRMIQFTQENLKEVYSPMYHELEQIFENITRPEDRERLLDSYFEKYTALDTSAYKLGSLELLDTLYELRDKYKDFKVIRDKAKWEEFWWELNHNLFFKVKEGYRSSIGLLYRDFKWQQYVQAKPYWMRFYLESMRFMFETVKGFNIISLILVYFSGSFELLGADLLPNDFWIFSLLILGMSVLATLVLILPNIQYLTLTSNPKDSFSRRVMRKLFPKLLVKWDNLFIGKKSYNDVPKMHEKRFF